MSKKVDKESRTVGRSFRIKEQWLDILKLEASKKGISPNALVNRIFQDYCLYHRHFKRNEGISLNKKLFFPILTACPKEDLLKIGKETIIHINKDVFWALGLALDYETWIYYITVILANYANWYESEHFNKGNRDVLYFRHNLGEKWSLFLAESVASIFKDVFNIEITKEFTQSGLTIEWPRPQSEKLFSKSWRG